METAKAEVPDAYQEYISSVTDWKKIVKWAGDLPPLPHVASQALALIEDPDVTAGKVTKLLGQDAALAARVLKIANSAMFARQREITTLSQAIMLIGFKALKGIIVAATLRQISRRLSSFEKMIWENSTCAAIAAQILCTTLRKRFNDEAFLMGLLHDLGKLVLLNSMKGEYEALIHESKTGQLYAALEQKAFGCTHALIGAMVAKKWNFSDGICNVILHHHDPVDRIDEVDLKEKILIIQTADLIAHALGYGHLEGYPNQDELLGQHLSLLGIEGGARADLLNQIESTFAEQGRIILGG